MAKFFNTSATSYYLEELIRTAKDRLILISPFLKLNDRIKELLEDKNRLKIDARIIYGKNKLQTEYANLYDIHRAGIEILSRELGPAGMIRFLQQYETGSGDYSKERHQWLGNMTIEEIAEHARKRRKE